MCNCIYSNYTINTVKNTQHRIQFLGVIKKSPLQLKRLSHDYTRTHKLSIYHQHLISTDNRQNDGILVSWKPSVYSCCTSSTIYVLSYQLMQYSWFTPSYVLLPPAISLGFRQVNVANFTVSSKCEAPRNTLLSLLYRQGVASVHPRRNCYIYQCNSSRGNQLIL